MTTLRKNVLDVISNFFLTSDSGCYTNVYHETRLEDVERTMIYLLSPEKFPLWLYEKQQNLVSKN